WAFTVAGWALSTGAVSLVENVGQPHSTFRTLSVMFANIAGFGVLWVLKFFFLDKIMFGRDHHTPYDADIEAEEARLAALEGSAVSDQSGTS
ncbi:MAG: hypothetical protein ABI239_04030, partial [Aquihabitans sp.]